MVRFPGSIVSADLDQIVDRELPWSDLAGATVLVTGASGMLPAYAIRTLLRLNDRFGIGIRVLGSARNPGTARRNLPDVLERRDFGLFVHDVSAPMRVPGPLDYVIHGASAARPAQHSTDPVGTLKANVTGSLHLLDLCVAKRSTAFVLMSSAEVYGTQTRHGTATPIDENSYGTVDPLHPRSCYSEGKRAAETAAAAYQSQYGLTTRCVRFGHVYGPGMRLDDGRVQADFAADVVAGTDIVLNSDGSSVRTYTYVADAIAGMYYALLRGSETAYNVADPRGQISIRDLALLFARARPAKQLQLAHAAAVDARRYSPVRGLALDSTRLQAIGWRPLVDLPTGIDRWLTELEGQPSVQSHSS